jgi:2-methylcitrate dehydratase
MNPSTDCVVAKPVDSIQRHLTDYACNLNYDGLPPEAVHAAKVRIIDTLGALVCGFSEELCLISRNLAAQIPNPKGATVIGTRMKTTPDMAAFVNATTARCVELNDSYHWPGSSGGHPSDVVMPVLAAAEHAGASGRDFITGIVLAYEIFCRISDVFHNNKGFDPLIFACLGSATAAGKLLGLSSSQLSHCISMAIVPNNMLIQARKDSISMFKSAASGQAGRAAVFAALLARAGMEGPHLPFEGKAGWCDHVARERFSLGTMGGKETPFKILNSQIKPRATCGTAMSSVLAAEKIGPVNISEIERVIVEVYKDAKERVGTGAHRWNPDTRETADHSAPYNVAVTLMEGTVTPRSFDNAHLWNPDLRALMQKIEVIENEEFTKAYKRLPVEHRTRVTVVTRSGERLVGETGGGVDDMAARMSDTQIDGKFRGLTEDILGVERVNNILESLWHLEDMEDVASIPPAFIID